MMIILGSTGGLGKGLLEQAQSESSLNSWKCGAVQGASKKDVDLTDESSITHFVKTLESTLQPGEPIKIINATGVSLNGMLHKLSTPDFEHTLKTNVTGNFLLLKHLQPLLRERRGSSIVILSSVVGEIGVVGTIAYASSKSALRGLCRVSAKELAKLGVTVNLIELGYFEAGMIHQVPENHQENLKNEIPLRRFGKVSELFEACQFALNCNYLTGSFVKLNGGLA